MSIKKFNEFNISESSSPEKKDWNPIHNKVISDLGLNFELTSIFGLGVTFFYPIVESLLHNTNNINVTDEMVVMITICVFSILLKENKSEIKKLISDIRLQGSYGIMKSLYKCIISIKDLLIIVYKSAGKIINTIVDIFSYTAMSVPCLTMLHELISKSHIGLDTFISSFATIGIGIVTISTKHLLSDYISKLKNKLSELDIKSFLSFFKLKSDKIKNINDFKKDELIKDSEIDISSIDINDSMDNKSLDKLIQIIES